jgi:glycosyltransferase involved in cell wall biosynthesis
MKISVCVPVRNEEESIQKLMDELLGQTRAPDEIVITDGGSTDSTRELIERYIANHSQVQLANDPQVQLANQPPVQLIRESAALPGRGRNIAAKNASYEWLAFIDAGVFPAMDWLEKLAACADDAGAVDVVFGAWEPVTDSFFKECAAIAYAYVPRKTVDEQFIKSRFIACSLMRRGVWERVGGFQEHLRSAEDLLFMNAIDETGFRVAYCPKAVVFWMMPSNLWSTFNRCLTYSRHNLRAGLGQRGQLIILCRYVALVLIGLMGFAFGWWWPVIAVALWLMMLFARGTAAILRNRENYPGTVGRNVRRMFWIVPILGALDLATILGTCAWVIKDKLWPGRRAAPVADAT